MISRIYADNFRCFQNFELPLDRVNLLLGRNGSGKSSALDVLQRLQLLLSGGVKVLQVFPPSELTRWQDRRIQAFEVDVTADDSLFRYVLHIEHDVDLRQARIIHETLFCDGKPLFVCEKGKAKLFHDDHTFGGEYPFDWSQSGVGFLVERKDNQKLTRFKREISGIIVLSVVPCLMDGESRREDNTLSRHGENFASWYRHIIQDDTGALVSIVADLRESLPGFNALNLKEAGEARLLKVNFQNTKDAQSPIPYAFTELSDGQKVLLLLYTLLHGIKRHGASLFLDEPDNYVGLREIQPWLSSLVDLVGDGVEQAVLISHHPEIINYIGNSSGIWFKREPNEHVRVTREAPLAHSDILLSELIARGWEESDA